MLAINMRLDKENKERLDILNIKEWIRLKLRLDQLTQAKTNESLALAELLQRNICDGVAIALSSCGPEQRKIIANGLLHWLTLIEAHLGSTQLIQQIMQTCNDSTDISALCMTKNPNVAITVSPHLTQTGISEIVKTQLKLALLATALIVTTILTSIAPPAIIGGIILLALALTAVAIHAEKKAVASKLDELKTSIVTEHQIATMSDEVQEELSQTNVNVSTLGLLGSRTSRSLSGIEMEPVCEMQPAA